MILDVAWLIPVFPLIAFVLIIFFFNKNKRLSSMTAVAAILISLAMSLGVLAQMIISEPDPENPFVNTVWTWAPIGDTCSASAR